MKKTGVVFLLFTLGVFYFTQCNTAPEKERDTTKILSPAEAITDFKIEDGFEIQTVASEPLIEDPVALLFDEDGAMWVVEMRGYMQDKEGHGETLPLGRIKILRDANNDGTYETATLFLDSLIMPRAVVPVKGGALLIEPPNLFFVENNGGKAGKKMLIDFSFAEGGNVEHQPNGLMRAMDNWIYVAKSNKRIRLIDGKWVIEKTQFRGQWGITQDNYGRLFYNDNSTTLMGDNFAPNAFGLNDAFQLQSNQSYGVKEVSNRVFPARKTAGVNRGYDKGTLDSNKKLINVTAACGPVIYRGDNFPDSYQGNAFVMEPSGFLIKRILLASDTNGFISGKFAYNDKEFLTATDERFRPVNAFTAPDGTLFFIDMHRGVIQHTTYLTPYLRHYIDSLNLERPIGMGRIYRIKWKDHGVSKKMVLSKMTTGELVNLLQHKNGWYRDMAQRVLIDRGDTSSIKALESLAASSNVVTALHAVYTLEGMNALTPAFLQQAAINTESNIIYTTCMKLLENFRSDKTAFAVLNRLAEKKDRFVALQYVNSLPYFEKAFPAEVKKKLLEQVEMNKADTLFTDAFISSAGGKEVQRLTWFPNSITDSAIRKALKNTIAKKEQAKKNPAATLSKKEAELYYAGQDAFKKFCATCHGPTGDGIQNVAPPLVHSGWVLEKDASVPIRILLDGLNGPVEVAGKRYAPPEYTGSMPGLRNNIETNNGMIAGVLTYVRNAWGNKAAAVGVDDVARVRKATSQRQQPYTTAELKKN
ncbi:MAG TPA: c-type cytochrome [Chitinophagaceae bacterium]|nr:c-type cytochrome [Chitinophagaceae bacterium]